MRFLKNRTVLGVLCIVLSLIICFAVTPLFNKAMSEKTEIVRVVKPISVGEEITSDMVKTIEVGSYNLPDDVVKHSDIVVGAFASADLAPGDYILTSKIAEEPAAENAYLYHLTGEKQAISVTVKAFANGLSGKLKSGDIVSVIAPDYRKQGKTVIPAELQYVEVIAVTANSGYDANTGEELEDGADRELPGTVTLLVTPEQSMVLAELEADGKLHLSLVYRGDEKSAGQFLEAQNQMLTELYPPEDMEGEAEENETLDHSDKEPEETKAEEQEETRQGETEEALNFLKNSIFSRGAGDSSPDWEPENENQMLAVWGSPGSGKTTTAVKLAARLAMQKKDVALLLCDMNTPMLPCICPPGDLEEEHSLGSVLAATHVSESLVRHNCITHKKIRHLTILGMRKGENEYTYPPYERTQAEELLQCLRKIAPYIIVDCGSCIANDILSAIALMEADAVLRLVNCDLKSISYLSSQLPLLKDSQWDAEKQYKVASNVYPNEASEHIERVLGNVAFQIPHSEEVKAQVLEGNLLKELVLKDSKGFRKTMEAITKEVFGC